MRIKAFFHVSLLFVATAILPFGASAQRVKRPVRPVIRPIIRPITAQVTVSASNLPPEKQRRLEAFSVAWNTIDDNYYDKTFGGLDWNKVRTEFEPRVVAAKTDAEFHVLLTEMIGRLGRSHLAVIIPEYFDRLEKAKVQARKRGRQMAAERAVAGKGAKNDADADGEETDEDLIEDQTKLRFGIGVELRMMNDQIVITQVEKQSGATLAGLRPGFVIDKVNGVSIKALIDQLTIAGTKKSEIGYLLPIQIVEFFLNGQPDTSVYLSCLDADDKPQEFTVPRLELPGEAVSISKNLPDQFLKFQYSSLSDDVGYIKFNAFAVPVIGKFCDALTALGPKKALIVDLRGNLGGLMASMIGLSGMMSDKALTLGTYNSRAGNAPFVGASKAKNFKGRVVVLVDALSMSAAELFTAGLQGNNKAIVVGDRTGGKSLPANWTKLSTGAVLVYPIADFITPKGVSLEGNGLEPDFKIALDRKSLLGGTDLQLQKALAVVRDDAAFAKLAEPVRVGGSSGSSGAGQPPVPKTITISKNPGSDSSGSSDAPPPPRAITKLGSLSAYPANPPPMTLTRVPSDARSLQIIADFAAASGGLDAFKNIKTYEVKGRASIGASGETDGEMYSAREAPDKYLMVFDSPTLGEIREIHNGKTELVQADYGIDTKIPEGRDAVTTHLFSPVFNTLDPDFLKTLKFEGTFDIEGRKRHVLSGTSPTGYAIGLSFDAETKMLVTYSQPGLLYELGDYKKSDGFALPFRIQMDGLMKITLASISLNPKIDPKAFEKKEKCFDKAN